MRARPAIEKYLTSTAADKLAAGSPEMGFRTFILRPEYTFVRSLRLAELLLDLSESFWLLYPVFLIYRILFQRKSERLGFVIPLRVFGPGLSIAHIGTITVNSDARVGSFCRIHPGVVIGAVRGEAPVIGDYVFLGPNSCVVGPIALGDRCHVGPNCVVATDLKSDSKVFPHRPHVVEKQQGETWLAENMAFSSK
jgi:serine O-acetyltransferase